MWYSDSGGSVAGDGIQGWTAQAWKLECDMDTLQEIDRLEWSARSNVRVRLFALASLSAIILFFIYDLIVDAFIEGELVTVHFAVESIVFVGASLVLVFNVRDLRRLRTRLFWEERRNRGLSGALAEVIDEQMEEWKLTRSEKDIAWLILKGYRFVEIAELRRVKQSTPRLQATSVYAKAGVSGRAEFVAEILQPLLMTIPDAPPQSREKRFAGTEPS